ncbi:MAG: signal recognition particle-docking protein FtsY [Limnothrix sp. RL_2_0]|nr:signal recognition particle-docking protein FtsY [Limnothrix sp. RL_2_0]
MAIFDWFRRKTTDKPPETPKPKVEEPKVAEKVEDTAVGATETPTEIDYLAWAKTAYKNVQEQKQQAATSEPVAETAPTEPPVEPEVSAPIAPAEEKIVAEDIVEADIAATLELTAPSITSTEITAEPIEVAPEIELEPIESEPIESPSQLESETIETESIEVVPAIESDAIESEAMEPTSEIESELIESEPVEPSPEIEPEVIEPDPVEPSITLTSEPAIAEPETTASEAASMPAWMKKTDGLEKLKETAIDTDDLEFDEDFLWSAKVLADQGRDVNDISLEEIEWLKKLREGLGKTRRSLVNQLKAVVGQGPLNDEAVLEIESLLLQADVGVAATDYIIETLQARLREEALPPEEAIAYLKEILRNILDEPLSKLETTEFAPKEGVLNIWMLTGVNGAGKTTTIGKLAHLANQSGYSCVIAAADTFRAAAVEQVKVWGDRTGTPVIANPGKNTDPAAVVFDGISAAKSRDAQILLVDTAGRLQNKKNLMDELAKIRRIIDKKAPDANIESLLVLDSTLGQNGLRQAEVFSGAAKLSGVVLTKLDGTARGGVALAVSQQLGLPIRFIGAGEGIEDLRPFSSYEFVEALLDG